MWKNEKKEEGEARHIIILHINTRPRRLLDLPDRCLVSPSEVCPRTPLMCWAPVWEFDDWEMEYIYYLVL